MKQKLCSSVVVIVVVVSFAVIQYSDKFNLKRKGVYSGSWFKCVSSLSSWVYKAKELEAAQGIYNQDQREEKNV